MKEWVPNPLGHLSKLCQVFHSMICLGLPLFYLFTWQLSLKTLYDSRMAF